MSTVCFMEGWNQYTVQLELILLFIFTNGNLNKNLKTNKQPKKAGFPFLQYYCYFGLISKPGIWVLISTVQDLMVGCLMLNLNLLFLMKVFIPVIHFPT